MSKSRMEDVREDVEKDEKHFLSRDSLACHDNVYLEVNQNSLIGHVDQNEVPLPRWVVPQSICWGKLKTILTRYLPSFARLP